MTAAVEVHHEVSGPEDAPPLVLSPSLGSTLAMWDPMLAALGDRVRAIRYDHRGHGRSPVPPGPYTLADLGADVIALLDRLGLERAHVCGLSLGGMVAMWLAANAPERVDRVVLLCTSARLGPASMWAERAALVRAQGTGAVAEAVVDRWLTPGYAAANPGLVADLRRMVAATPPEGYAGCCEAIERMDLLGDLARIRAPTLVVAAADDPATPPEHGEGIAGLIPGARLEVVDDAAHLAAVERPDQVAALVAGHLGL